MMWPLLPELLLSFLPTLELALPPLSLTSTESSTRNFVDLRLRTMVALSWILAHLVPPETSTLTGPGREAPRLMLAESTPVRADATMKLADRENGKDRELNPEGGDSPEAPGCENKRSYLYAFSRFFENNLSPCNLLLTLLDKLGKTIVDVSRSGAIWTFQIKLVL
jgi:hypothetical protein